MNKINKGILLVNLGSPNSYSIADVKKYLLEFLMDERVIDVPAWWRSILVKGIIVPFRAKKSSNAYKKIWTKSGFPLLSISNDLKQKLQEEIEDIPIALGMRYSTPSIESALLNLKKNLVNDILVFLLYPHYAMSSYETAMVKVEEQKKIIMPNTKLTFHPPFYNDDDYIMILTNILRESMSKDDWDHLIFSYHGIPERHLGKYHKITEELVPCSGCKGNVAETCYRRHCIEMTMAIVNKLKLADDDYSISFQSRLGNSPWLKPYTYKEVERVAELGKKKLLVITPSFVADCLETLEEIGMEAKKDFLKLGGEKFKVVPCPNYRDDWVSLIKKWSINWISKN